jgi:molybdopterin biosynthesis enzyme
MFDTGRSLTARDLLRAQVAGLPTLRVRRPRVRLVNIPGGQATTQFVAASARAAGAEVEITEAAGRDAASIAGAFDVGSCDLLFSVGGTGVGRTDATVTALAARGDVLAHGIALQPGRTAAFGRIGTIPVVALPGAPDQAFAAWWALARPVLDRLSEHRERATVRLPLARKIASSVGIAELVLLKRKDNQWAPLAIGELSLGLIAHADAWLLVPGGAEGFAAGTLVDGYMLGE